MRKACSQPSLAPLSSDEKEQLAEWLRHDTYDVVLDRVTKPRPNGFGLKISRRPLQIFYAKVLLLDALNARASQDKKMTLEQFETIANPAGLLFSTNPNIDSSTNPSADFHNAIFNAACDLVHSGDNTPTQLLALQRLADFPARAAHRAHKVAMDLDLKAQRKEMNEYRKQLNERRLAQADKRIEISNRLAKVREEEFALKQSASRNRTPDHPKIPVTPELIRARVIAKYGFDAEELGRKAQERAQAASLPSEKTPLINTGIHAGASTPTLSPASVSTLSKPTKEQPTNERTYETNNAPNRMPESA